MGTEGTLNRTAMFNCLGTDPATGWQCVSSWNSDGMKALQTFPLIQLVCISCES